MLILAIPTKSNLKILKLIKSIKIILFLPKDNTTNLYQYENDVEIKDCIFLFVCNR